MLNLNEGAEEDVNKFCEVMHRLLDGGKLGCVLIQLPPSFTYDYADRLENFFEVLPKEFAFAVEFRDLSWMNDDTWKLLSKHRVAYTSVDEPLLPPNVRVTSDVAYFRWHGRGRRPWFDYRYREEELKPWVPRIKETATKVKKVYGYFNNHYHGYAVENCLQVLEMLGVLTPEQSEAKAHIKKHFLLPEGKQKVEVATLDQWTGQSLEDLLLKFTGTERLKRAKQIKAREIIVEELSDSMIRATVRDYHIVVDIGNKIVLHDCADWNKLIPQKRFCKHLGKLMLSINEEKALQVLGKISSEIEYWQFKPYTERPDQEAAK
jgi:hypothetical protein